LLKESFFSKTEGVYIVVGHDGLIVYQGNINDNNIEKTIEKDMSSYPYFILMQAATNYGGIKLRDFFRDIVEEDKLDLLKLHVKEATEDYLNYNDVNQDEKYSLELSLKFFDKIIESL